MEEICSIKLNFGHLNQFIVVPRVYILFYYYILLVIHKNQTIKFGTVLYHWGGNILSASIASYSTGKGMLLNVHKTLYGIAIINT